MPDASRAGSHQRPAEAGHGLDVDPFALPVLLSTPAPSGDAASRHAPNPPVEHAEASVSHDAVEAVGAAAALADADLALLASLPDDPSLLDWPSTAWNEHLADCGEPRSCSHAGEVRLPDWWWARMKALTPLAADPQTSVEIAMRRINTYRGGKRITPEGAAFTRDTVRDALLTAPQPVSREWVSQTLACVGGLATWVHNEGEPLTREHVFDPDTWLRYLNGPTGATHLDKYTRRNYRLRYDKLAGALLGSQREVIRGRKPVGQPDALMPLTHQQETDLWVWSQGLRPASVRQRIQGLIVTGLGIGARRRDFITIRSRDVTRDFHGVRVALPESTSTGDAIVPARTVTCSGQWEDRLWALAQSIPDDHFLAAPWRNTEPDRRSVDATMRNAINNDAAAPPLDFSIESLRNTWLLRHVEAGTPIPLLKEQGGLLTTVTLDKLVPFAAPLALQQAAARMRLAPSQLATPGLHLVDGNAEEAL